MSPSSALVFVTHTGQVSGAEVVLLDLVRLALAQGRHVAVAAPAGPLLDRLPPGAQHVELPPLGLGDLPRPLAAADLARRSAVAARRLSAACAGEPRVVVNGLLALPAVRLLRPAGGAAWLVHDTVHRADQVAVVRAARPVLRRAVAVSAATAAPLRALGLPVVVAHNGVRWPVEPAPLAVSDPPLVGALALLTPWKGHAVLLDAVGRLPGVRLELAGGSFPGDRAHVERLQRRAAEPDLRGRVAFLGHVDPLTALRRWDVAVSASTSPEAGPISVLEAMSLGVPVVGTAHGGTVEFLEQGAGLLVPPGDPVATAQAVHRLLTDPELRASTAAAGRRAVAERHDLSRTLPELLQQLEGP